MQLFDRSVGEIVNHVCMSLEHADIVSDRLCDAQQFLGCMHISRDAEIGTLDGDQAEQVGGEGGQ